MRIYIKKSLLNLKRIKLKKESDDEELIKNLYEKAEKKNVKRQIRYPKKNN